MFDPVWSIYLKSRKKDFLPMLLMHSCSTTLVSILYRKGAPATEHIASRRAWNLHRILKNPGRRIFWQRTFWLHVLCCFACNYCRLSSKISYHISLHVWSSLEPIFENTGRRFFLFSRAFFLVIVLVYYAWKQYAQGVSRIASRAYPKCHARLQVVLASRHIYNII